MNTRKSARKRPGLLPAFVWNSLFLLKPMPLTATCILLWRWLRAHGHYLHKASEGPMIAGTLVVIGIIYTIVASKALDSALEDVKVLSKAVKEGDEHAFMLNRDERVPMVIHLFLGAVTVMLIATLFSIQYEESLCGTMSIGFVSHITFQLYFVVKKIDDPLVSPWFQAETPEKCLNQSFDEYIAKWRKGRDDDRGRAEKGIIS